jgi:hypothetical protein
MVANFFHLDALAFPSRPMKSQNSGLILMTRKVSTSQSQIEEIFESQKTK